MPLAFPTEPGELTAATLAAALQRPVADFTLVPIGVGRGNLGDIVRIDFGPGRPPVVAKFAADRVENLRAARRSGLFEREIRFYRSLAPSLGVRLPACHAAEYDPDSGRFFLLLEHIESVTELDTIAGIGRDRTAAVLDELAQLHAAGRRFPDEDWLQDMRHQARIDNLTSLIDRGWPTLTDLCPDQVRIDERARMIDRMVALMHQMAELPSTIVHGDVKPDNLLAPPGGGVALLDWQAVGYGPPAWDVAATMLSCLTIDDRRDNEAALLASYPGDLAGYEEALLFGLVVAVALTVLGDPDEPRRPELVRTLTARTVAALDDHGVR